MEESIVIAGFGGQGILFAGQLLVHAAFAMGRHVTWIPSYGPEMRGGTAHCTVVISDEPIGSPLVRHPDVVIAMNQPSVERYTPLIKSGGLLLINSSLANRPDTRTDLDIVAIDANAIAAKTGHEQLANVVMLGAYLSVRATIPIETLAHTLQTRLPERHRHLLAANLDALQAGFAVTKEKFVALSVPLMIGYAAHPRHLSCR
jgi:2-oxoglutarate ferredoxin oxidoreductase subunit gamma